jgi:uncharacterized tellurite resistance protein B-like protein
VSFANLMQRFRDGNSAAREAPRHDPLQLATAAILLEIGWADGSLSDSEDHDLVDYLRRAFHLQEDDARALERAAEEIRGKTIDHFALTNFIRRNASLEERIDIVKTMWRIVFADGKLTDYENYLVRKLADLLGLEHPTMIEAKVAVMRSLGL